MKRSKTKSSPVAHLNVELMGISPMTQNQKLVLESKNHMVLEGCAGTGKTFLSSFLGYKDVLDRKYKRLIYVRSAVPTRNIGFYPGTPEEKTKEYELPYTMIAKELFNRGDAYPVLKNSGTVQFMTTCHIRGTTIDDSVIIVDETQNMTFQELDSIITRFGNDCRVFFCGDYNQRDERNSGSREFNKILRQMGEFDFVEFTPDDIVRSGLVRSYIKTKYESSIK
jgi:phosphate starvation-inducible PhoH-like protein